MCYSGGMERAQILDSIVRLAGVEARAPEDLRGDIGLVRERLEDQLGQTVRPAEAARLLHVTPPALKRWLDKGEIASVLTPSGRREIPIAEVVGLLRDVERAREDGRERALAAVVRERRSAAARLDLDRLLPPKRPRTHRDAELQSLAYHRLVAERLTPELVERAARQLDRWERTGRIHPHWAAEWRLLLGKPLEHIKRAITSDAVRARELRQTSPFTRVVTEQERRRLLDAVEARRG